MKINNLDDVLAMPATERHFQIFFSFLLRGVTEPEICFDVLVWKRGFISTGLAVGLLPPPPPTIAFLVSVFFSSIRWEETGQDRTGHVQFFPFHNNFFYLIIKSLLLYNTIPHLFFFETSFLVYQILNIRFLIVRSWIGMRIIAMSIRDE